MKSDWDSAVHEVLVLVLVEVLVEVVIWAALRPEASRASMGAMTMAVRMSLVGIPELREMQWRCRSPGAEIPGARHGHRYGGQNCGLPRRRGLTGWQGKQGWRANLAIHVGILAPWRRDPAPSSLRRWLTRLSVVNESG